ncbi:hypothetical protein [Streptomyces sp. SAI-149]|uniref:hypothetical protein n=1 Tax=unclassified Streptomyces TaxID=2593676 RepID=UPI0024770B71|nr:hypothetical protein [Streptomyces sp. SAI-149]MDH6502571.1 hypothetical protein [Streptomyces sp. SAI-149]
MPKDPDAEIHGGTAAGLFRIQSPDGRRGTRHVMTGSDTTNPSLTPSLHLGSLIAE